MAIKYAMDAGLTKREQIDPEQPIMELQLLDDDGNPTRIIGSGGATVGAATKDTRGTVLMANSVSDPKVTTITPLSDGAELTVAVAKVNELVNGVNAIMTALDQLLANLRGSGVIEKVD